MRFDPLDLIGNQNLKLCKSKMADGHHMEYRKIAISPQLFG